MVKVIIITEEYYVSYTLHTKGILCEVFLYLNLQKHMWKGFHCALCINLERKLYDSLLCSSRNWADRHFKIIDDIHDEIYQFLLKSLSI